MPDWVYRIKALCVRMGGFAVVGVAATLIHVAMVLILVEFLNSDPVLATFMAFLVAVGASYAGNRLWVFRDRPYWRGQKRRFITVSVVSFLLNVLAMYMIVDILNWHYFGGLFVTLAVVPLITFVMHNYWSFSHGEA